MTETKIHAPIHQSWQKQQETLTQLRLTSSFRQKKKKIAITVYQSKKEMQLRKTLRNQLRKTRQIPRWHSQACSYAQCVVTAVYTGEISVQSQWLWFYFFACTREESSGQIFTFSPVPYKHILEAVIPPTRPSVASISAASYWLCLLSDWLIDWLLMVYPL